MSSDKTDKSQPQICRTCGNPMQELDGVVCCPRCTAEVRAAQIPMPRTVGKYVVESVLGSGSMGFVYKAAQQELNRSVALKVMVAGEHASRDVIARFVREARSIAKLSHPGIVPVFDMGVEGSLHYFVMEYVDGQSLRDLLVKGPIPVDAALRAGFFLAGALNYAHKAGVIHRDIKPSNILIDKMGRVRLVDFGLAKTMTDGSVYTQAGMLCGTPQYMSPEQALDASADVDARSDIYSLGAVLYEMLTGRPPVQGRNLLAILRKIELEEPAAPSQSNTAVPPEVDALVLRALAKDKNDRFATAGDFADAVQDILNVRAGSSVGLPSLPGAPKLTVRPTPKAPSLAGKPAPRRSRVAAWSLAFACALVVAVGAAAPMWWPLTPWGSLNNPPIEPVNPSEDAGRETAAAMKTTAAAREFIRLAEGLTAATARADRHALLSGALAALGRLGERESPTAETFLLRGRALRLGGDYAFARVELDRAVRLSPDNVVAREERLLSNHALSVMILGSAPEPYLRPRRIELIRDDAEFLLAKGDATARKLAAGAQLLAKRDYAAAAAELKDYGSATRAGRDLAMLYLDGLLHQAAAAVNDEAYQALYNEIQSVLKIALAENANHAGLLFCKARAVTVDRLVPSAAKRDEVLKVVREIRDVSPSRGPEELICQILLVTVNPAVTTAAAPAGLMIELNQAIERGRYDPAGEAGVRRETVPELHVLRAWALLFSGKVVDEAAAKNAIANDLDPYVKERPAVDEGPYLLRAVANAVVGKWREAQSDLRDCLRCTGKVPPATASAPLAAWAAEAGFSPARFLNATHRFLTDVSRPEYAQRMQDVLNRELRAASDGDAVFTLFDDEQAVPAAFRQGTVKAERGGRGDAFSGQCALTIKPGWAATDVIEGWNLRIAEKPGPGEYRWIRFAWKKTGGGGIGLAFPDDGVFNRGYRAGPGEQGWVLKAVAPAAPGEWKVCVFDLWRDFGAFTINALAVCGTEGGTASFDHIVLGRTKADVERFAHSRPVVRLFEDELHFNNQLAVGKGRHALETRDKFTGRASLYVTPPEVGQPAVWSWNYPIVENPGPGQYRFLRFAWKKVGGTRLAITLHFDAKSWPHGTARPPSLTYFAGPRPTPGGKRVGETVPADWAVVTCDLFQDAGGAAHLTGITFHPIDGDYALFDHIYLGRRAEDLNRSPDPGRAAP
jgi:predicted Ser/Thr protein kinase/tetratricopeptide (TPR) repeat protein